MGELLVDPAALARVASGAFATENSPYRRGPPLRAAMGGRPLARVEVAGDLTDALAVRMLFPNVTHEFVWDGGRSSRRRRLRAPSGAPASLFDEPLELVDRNEPRTPGHVDGLEQRQHPAVEGGAAHPERLGGLRPRVGQSVDVRCVTNDGYSGAEELGRRRRLPLAFLAFAPLPSSGHALKRTQTLTHIAPWVHLCLACYRGAQLPMRWTIGAAAESGWRPCSLAG